MKKTTLYAISFFSCFFFCLPVLTYGNAFAGVCIISDIDDTVKVTNVGTPETLFRALFSSKSFAGMAPLYRYLITSQSVDDKSGGVYFVTGSPESLREPLRSFLEKNNFPPSNKLFLRKNFFENICHFKISQIETIMKNNRCDKFILVGDDTECDPDIYGFIKSMYSDKVVATYIHIVRNERRHIAACIAACTLCETDGITCDKNCIAANKKDCSSYLAGQIFYYTAFDIALHEKAAHRLTSEQALLVADTIREEEFDKNTIIPYFAACPEDDNWLEKIAKDLKLGSEFGVRIGDIQDKIKNICAQNKKFIESRDNRPK